MWQFSLFFEKEVFYYIKQLKDNLQNICSNQRCCIRIFSKNENFVLVVAIPKEIYEKNILYIKEKIIQIILFYYKPKIIFEGIKNFSTKQMSNRILLDILCNFESQIETNTIFKRLHLCDKLFLSSFINFSLCDLIKNWQEMAKLINQNSNFLDDEYTKFELMRFLLNGIQCKANKIDISKEENTFNIFEDDTKVFPNQNLFYFCSEFDSLMFLIISKSPQNVVINKYLEFDARFIDNLYNLLGDRLKLVE